MALFFGIITTIISAILLAIGAALLAGLILHWLGI